MAIFTSTSSYSDPIKALSIKALEKRLADVQANAQEAPASMPSPWQGAAHMMGKIGEGIQQGRSEGALAAQRQALSQAMAGVQNGAPTPEQLATITSADPDLGKTYAQQIATARENAANRAAEEARSARTDETTRFVANQQVGSHLTGINTQTQAQRDIEAARETAAAERSKAEISGRETTTRLQKEAEERIAAERRTAETETQRLNRESEERRSQPEFLKLQAAHAKAVAEGRTDEADAIKQAIDRQKLGSVAEQNAAIDVEKSYTGTVHAINTLQRSKQLLKQGINAHIGAGLTTVAGQLGVLGPEGKARAERTKEFNSNMNLGVTETMAERLTGAKSNFEFQKFMEIMNDPSVSAETKENLINDRITQAQDYYNQQKARVQRLGKDPDKLATLRTFDDPAATKPTDPAKPAPTAAPTGGDGSGTGPMFDQARNALKNGKDPAAVRDLLKKLGGDPSKL